MDEKEIRDKLIKKSGALTSLKAYESRLAGVLHKIRTESLDKLKQYQNEHEQFKALVNEFEREWYPVSTYTIPPEGIGYAAGAFLRGIKNILKAAESIIDLKKETYDDGAGYDLPSGHVDQSERTNDRTNGPADSSPRESDRT